MITKSAYKGGQTIVVHYYRGEGLGKGTVLEEQKDGTFAELSPLEKLNRDSELIGLPVYHIAGLGAGVIESNCKRWKDEPHDEYVLAHFYRDDGIPKFGPKHNRRIAIENLRTWNQERPSQSAARYCGNITKYGVCGFKLTESGCPVCPVQA